MDRDVLIEYDDDADDADDGDGTQDSLEVEETAVILDHLARVQDRHITPIALKIAYCQGVNALTEPDDLSDRLHVALEDLSNKIDPSSFETGSIMAYIRELVIVDTAIDVALGVVDEAPSSHRGYQLIGEGLADVKIKIASASEAAHDVLESGE